MYLVLAIFSFLISSFAFAQEPLYNPLPYVVYPQSFYLKGDFSYFLSQNRKDVDGNTISNHGDEKYRRMEAEVSGFYGLFKNFQLGSGLRLRQNSSTKFYSNTIGTETLNQSGLESFFIEGKYGIPTEGDWSFAFLTRYRMPLYTNDTYRPAVPNDFIVLGDQASEITVGGSLNFNPARRRDKHLGAEVLYNIPNQGLSQEVLYRLEGAFLEDKWALKVGAYGVYSLKTDEYSDTPLLKPSIGEGATQLVNGVNRSFLAPFAGAHILFSPHFRMETQVAYHMMGKSTDEGLKFNVGIVYSFKKDPAVKKLKKLESKFKEYSIDGRVVTVSEAGGFVRINVGVVDEVALGMNVDFYEYDHLGENVLIAQGVIVRVLPQQADVKIKPLRRDIPIKKGQAARIWQR